MKKLLFILLICFNINTLSATTVTAGETLEGLVTFESSPHTSAGLFTTVEFDLLVPSHGLLTLHAKGDGSCTSSLYHKGDVANKSYIITTNTSLNQGTADQGISDVHLFSGTYLIEIKCQDNAIYNGSDGESSYVLDTILTQSAQSLKSGTIQFDTDPNSTFHADPSIEYLNTNAIDIQTNTNYTDSIGYILSDISNFYERANNVDYFKFTLESEEEITINYINSAEVQPRMKLYGIDPNNGVLKVRTLVGYSSAAGDMKIGDTELLEPGTYYLEFKLNGADYVMDYTFIVNSSSTESIITTDTTTSITPSQIDIAKLYVATFNRAPDKAGLDYWIASNLSLAEIAQSFFDQNETLELYPVDSSNREFINSVYQNLFNRVPDTAGWDYWEAELNRGAYSRNLFIQTVIDGAQGDDVSILNNKTEVGISFSSAGMNNTDDAKSIMQNITANSDSVTTANGYITSGSIPSLVTSPVGGECSAPSIEGISQKYITLTQGSTDYYNINICGSVQIMTSDSNIASVSRFTNDYVDEVKVTAVAPGEATITVSDNGGAAYIFVTVEATTHASSNINWLSTEPDGYHSWSEANAWCTNQGYRLPLMSELIEAWNAGGATISPSGFEKDTFYWSSESSTSADSHKACAMDYDCSSAGEWPDSSYGHPKCVIE